MSTYTLTNKPESKDRLTRYIEKHRLGYSEFVEELPSLSELESGDIVIVESLGDLFRDVDDFLKNLELLKLNWVELHIVDFESVNLDGNITWGNLSGVIPSLIRQLENWKSGEISKKYKKVKEIQREKSVYRGGRKEKGFTVRKIGRKQVQIIDEQEKIILERILKWKLERDNEFDRTGKNEKISIRYIHNRLRTEFEMDWIKEITDSKGKRRRIEKFGLTTLYRLLDDNYHNNVVKRLERIDGLNLKD
jgi:DNA invertase Pin-like site-specific DNA recombinase